VTPDPDLLLRISQKVVENGKYLFAVSHQLLPGTALEPPVAEERD